MADTAKLLETLHPMREPPPPPSIAPLLLMTTIGCLSALAILVVWWHVRRRRSDLRRSAEASLAATRILAADERLAAQALLLRRLMRGLRGDADARAQGRVWLENLDKAFDTLFFTEGDGKVFGEGLYRPLGATDVDALDRSLSGLFAKVRA